MPISIRASGPSEVERARRLFLELPIELPDGSYTLKELEAVASLYQTSYINLLAAKMQKAERKVKGRQKGDGRRTKQNMEGLRVLLHRIAQADKPVTVRQMFYRLASDYQVIAKLEAEYNGTVDRLMVEMRRDKSIPFQWVADSSRWMRKPTTYASLRDMLRETAKTYRRDLWAQSGVYVEVWCEKDALAGVLSSVTEVYDVPLMVARGFSSHSYLYSAAENICAIGKPAYIYLLGDHDPSGQDALRHTRERLTEYVRDLGGRMSIHFEVLGVTPEQIKEWNLPSRPPKKGDSRAKKFKGAWVDLDAIPSPRLRALVQEAIERHVDPYQLANVQAIEERERETLEYLTGLLQSADVLSDAA